MKTFTLFRNKDVSGVSGTGTVAEGVQFHDGQVVLSWFGHLHSIEVHKDIATLLSIHGHSGTTEVRWTPSPSQSFSSVADVLDTVEENCYIPYPQEEI